MRLRRALRLWRDQSEHRGERIVAQVADAGLLKDDHALGNQGEEYGKDRLAFGQRRGGE